MKNEVSAISAKELDDCIRRKAVIIDLRDRRLYEKEHIKGAISIPYEMINYMYFERFRGREIVLYCDRGAASMMTAKELSKRGYNAKSVIGGISAYRGKELQKH